MMNIETSAPAVHPKAVSANASHGAKGKAQTSKPSDETTTSGFLALLAALGSDSAGDTVTDVSTEAPPDLTMSVNAPVATPDAYQVSLLSGSNAAALPTQIESSDLALMLAQADTTTGTVAALSHAAPRPPGQAALQPKWTQPGAAIALRGNAPIGKGFAAEVVTPTFSDGTTRLMHAGPTAVNAAGTGLLLTPTRSPLATGAATTGKSSANTAMAATAPDLGPDSTTTGPSVNPAGEALTPPLPESKSIITGAEARTSASINLALSRAMQQASSTNMPASATSATTIMSTLAVSEALLHPLDRNQTKFVALATGNGIEGAWRASDAPAGAAMTAPQAPPDPSTSSLQSMVAETLSYWVTHGVQKAELTLDGFGEPVQVSVSVKGDEAQLAFRTDQPEIRQILEGATAHLKDILGSEGLLLSGVSVGTSGQHDAGTQKHNNRSDLSLSSASAADDAPAQIQRRANPSVGTAVDLFV